MKPARGRISYKSEEIPLASPHILHPARRRVNKVILRLTYWSGQPRGALPGRHGRLPGDSRRLHPARCRPWWPRHTSAPPGATAVVTFWAEFFPDRAPEHTLFPAERLVVQVMHEYRPGRKKGSGVFFRCRISKKKTPDPFFRPRATDCGQPVPTFTTGC